MLAIFSLSFLLFTAAAVDSVLSQDQNSGSDFNYKLLETRLDQLELKLKNTSDLIRTEQKLLLNSTNSLLEKIVLSLNVIARQTTTINSCDEATTTGRYRLQLPNPSPPIAVICDMEVLDGGWLVIQQRLDGSVNFNRSWSEYRDGFGAIGQSNEFWLGLETIHELMKNGNYELLVELKNEAGHYGYARYGRFKIAGKDQDYKLNSPSEYSGTIKDILSDINGFKFSTYDNDNDQWWGGSCAQKYGSGWWFDGCGSSKPNGPFKKDINTEQGIYWGGWTSAATYSRMLIRRK